MAAEGSMDIEQKLVLIRNLRNEQMINEDKIRRREELLHPNSVYHSRLAEPEAEAASEKGSFGFKFRVFIAMLLFLLFFYMDISQMHLGSLTSSLIVNAVCETFDINSFDFIKDIPYTLKDSNTMDDQMPAS